MPNPPIIPDAIFRVKIFPPIGIARVGDSGFNLKTGEPDLDTLEYFLPSEIPGKDVLEDGFKFREDPERREERIKRMIRERFERIFNTHMDLLNPQDKLYRERLDAAAEGEEDNVARDIMAELEVKLDDHHDRIKRQGVRFRVYAYNEGGENLGEITATGGYKLTWTVHVANHKASGELFRGMYNPPTGSLRNPDVQGDRKPEERDRLIVDPGPKTISSPDINATVDISSKFHGSKAEGVDVHLGQLRTNEEGHLIFIGGAGYAQCVTTREVPQPDIVSEFDSVDWIDDICDGWVKVVVDHDELDATIESSSKATVLSAPPKFAWGVRSPTTWYDLIADIYANQTGWKDDKGKGVEFYRDIWPVLLSTYALSWTNKEAFEGHGVSGKGNFLDIEGKLKSKGTEGRVFRQAVFNRLRAPDYQVLEHASTQYMPRLSGNGGDAVEPGMNLPTNATLPPIKRYAALTSLQYERFSLWNEGKFRSGDGQWNDVVAFEDVELENQPACLTLAALDHTIGEPLYPGIEVYWIAREPETYILEVDTDLVDTDVHGIDPPFRINHEVMAPGYLTRALSMPWQSDFDLCQYHWWPSIKPDDVINERFIQQAVTPEAEFINNVLPQRQKWSRGIRISPSDNPEYYPGSADMIKYWSRLGFVVERGDKKVQRGEAPNTREDPTWLETEREKIVRKDKKTHLPMSP